MEKETVSVNTLDDEIKKRLSMIYADIEELPEKYCEDFEVCKWSGGSETTAYELGRYAGSFLGEGQALLWVLDLLEEVKND